jgi:hypothetical protein
VAQAGLTLWLIDNTVYECIHEPEPPPPRVAAFSGRHSVYGGNAYQLAQRLRQLDEEERPKLDENGNPLPPEPTPSPEERKHALRQLVRAKFQEAENDALMETYALRNNNNEAVQAQVDAWRAEKEAKKAELAAARAEWLAARATKEWAQA